MASIRSCLIEIADCARSIPDDLGLRLDTVLVRTRTWSGTALGDGTSSDVDVELTPKPRVNPPDPNQTANQAGTYEDGVIWVDRISRTYAEADLGDGPLAANIEIIWLVGDEQYTLVSLEDETTEWRAKLRRRRGR